jgi:2-C-methyl-D-erythritol 4-phosphate cytidylyltransferase
VSSSQVERTGDVATVAAVVVAAGRGERLGGDRPKALVEVAGRSLVAHAVAGLRAAGVEVVIVVHTPGERDAFAAALDDEVVLVAGGADRSASVRAGLAALPDGVEVVAVHDAARAFAPPAVIAATIAAVTGAPGGSGGGTGPGAAAGERVVAAAPALPVADTLKRVTGDVVVGTVDRTDLVAVQTPQVLPVDVLRGVTEDGGSATDDLALVEAQLADGRLSGRIVWVPGSPLGVKITFAEDLVTAEALARHAAG